MTSRVLWAMVNYDLLLANVIRFAAGKCLPKSTCQI